jgi:hypothetical protein
MTLMRAATANGAVLTYDTDDVETLHIEQPHDVHDTTQPEDTAVHRELGQAHLVLRIDFKPGTDAQWVDKATAALADMRPLGDFLIAALDAEEIHPALASRIYNRFFYGNPTGPGAPNEREQLVHDDPELAEQIREGIAQADRGETVDLGSFAQHLDDEKATA